MNINISKILEIAIGPTCLLIGFLLREIWSGNKTEMKDLKQAIKDNSSVTTLNTLAVQKLTIQMENAEEKLDMVGELRRDVDKLGEKVRTMQS